MVGIIAGNALDTLSMFILIQNEKVPESLLLLSRAFYFPEEVQFEDRLKTILSSVPDSIKKAAEQKLAELSGLSLYFMFYMCCA
jgi:hypothetical protein